MVELQTKPKDHEVSLIDYVIIFFKRKTMIILVTFAFAVATAIISLMMTKVYRAETKILRPQQSPGIASQLMGQRVGAAGLTDSMLVLRSPNALYVALIQSRPIMEDIVARFNLVEIYGSMSMLDATERLKSNLRIKSSSRSGIITIAIEDTEPQRAADIANAFVEELMNLTEQFAITEAAQRRVFFAAQLQDAKETLIKAEEDMVEFQSRTGAIEINEQAKSVINAIERLNARILEKEVELRVMKTYSTSNNPDLQKIEAVLRGLRAELKKLGSGKGGKFYDLMSAENMPKVSSEYIRKYRELKFSETLYEIFLKQYESAKFDEARDAVVVQVLDKAVKPEKRYRPKRRQMVVIGTFIGFVFSVFLAFLCEYREKLAVDPRNREKIERLKRYVGFRSNQ
ncbi:MAG: Wzz/FepE/Etk N-terminal domain-containing protein [Nitrospirota bacterium]|nr:Wzz/FepE/Etk N-terminal domain-containing protein [Nitrospirota bacterium]